MTLARLISKTVWQWQVWRMRCQRERAYPELKALRLRKESCRRKHRKGTVESVRASADVLHAGLGRRA